MGSCVFCSGAASVGLVSSEAIVVYSASVSSLVRVVWVLEVLCAYVRCLVAVCAGFGGSLVTSWGRSRHGQLCHGPQWKVRARHWPKSGTMLCRWGRYVLLGSGLTCSPVNKIDLVTSWVPSRYCIYFFIRVSLHMFSRVVLVRLRDASRLEGKQVPIRATLHFLGKS